MTQNDLKVSCTVSAIRALSAQVDISQEQLVLIFMQECGSIERHQALKHLGIVDLPKRISDLVNIFGFRINKEKIDTKNQFGKPTHYMEYSLEV